MGDGSLPLDGMAKLLRRLSGLFRRLRLFGTLRLTTACAREPTEARAQGWQTPPHTREVL